jgi:hypothetical protein
LARRATCTHLRGSLASLASQLTCIGLTIIKIAPLDPEGHIDPILWKKYRDYCRVRRFWAGEEDEVGRLVHKPGGAEHARWVFDYNHPDEDDDDEAGYKFGAHAFLPGEYVSISGQNGKLHTFIVVTVAPVLLSVDLINSFELEIKV